ncbi:MAG: beta-ketoacyl-[acyl-carrier-protein] synthase family protein [Candidatus Brocadiaceae bacterium]|nr:beta-ketoacyl-[acyl-carrier-protein] synthase family protein [Candidatus Brocadiaceae bacterium]
MKKRIVVTGIGIVSPLGIGVNENWDRYLSGKSGIKEFETNGNGTISYAGKVDDNELETFVPEDKKGKIDRFSSFALVAAKMALGDAKIGSDFDREKIGVFIGSAYSGLNIIEKQIKMLYEEGPRKVHPLLMQNSLTNAPSGEIAIELDFKGPNIGFSCGACSSEYSIIQAYNVLQQRDIDAMVAGGTEAPLLPSIFEELRPKGLFHENDSMVNSASCPFDRDRNGFVLSEGAGMVVLETLSSAAKRGADIYGEIIGFGTSYSNNVYAEQKISSFDSKVSCAKQALEYASIDSSKVDYINASGISGIRDDREESEVLKSVFGREAQSIPISSTKGSLGLSLGASGATDAIFSLLCLRKNILPQTNNLENVDLVCNSLFHLKKSVEKSASIILSNNFSYCGNNLSLVFKRM